MKLLFTLALAFTIMVGVSNASESNPFDLSIGEGACKDVNCPSKCLKQATEANIEINKSKIYDDRFSSKVAGTAHSCAGGGSTANWQDENCCGGGTFYVKQAACFDKSAGLERSLAADIMTMKPYFLRMRRMVFTRPMSKPMRIEDEGINQSPAYLCVGAK